MGNVYTITCPHCGAKFYNVVVQRGGDIRCGRCNRVMTIHR